MEGQIDEGKSGWRNMWMKGQIYGHWMINKQTDWMERQTEGGRDRWI
jgi:hypothetical protein